MNKVIEYIISAKDATGNAIKSALGRIKSFASGVMGQLANIKAGFDMAAGVVRQFAGIFGSAIKEAFKFEKAQSDFAGLLNSAEKAKEHIAELRQFASSTPLTFGDLSQASKLLLSFGMNVEDVMPSMKMLGDIAMGDAQKFQGLSLVFAQVKSAGKLMGQDLLQMINQGFNPLTVIAQQTGKSVAELKDMMAEGAISFDMVAEAMRVATSEGGLFNNAMANASKTGEGLISTLQDKWTDVVRTFGEAFADTAKGGLQMLIEKLTQLVEDGTVDVWANKVARGLNKVVEVATSCAKAIGWVVDKYNAIRDWMSEKGAEVGAYVGTLVAGGSLDDAANASAEAGRSERRAQKDRDAENAASDEEARRVGIEKRAAKKVEAEKKQQAKSLAEMMVDAEAKARAIEQAKREKELAKLAKEEERERARVEKEIAKARKAEWDAYVKQVNRDNAEWQKADAEAKAALQTAIQNESQVWGWYKDKDAWKAQLASEKADAEAEVQFEKDFEHLKRFRKSWRTADNLSDEEEIVRRVAVAREEREAAEQYARQTAEGVAQMNVVLEQINETLTDGGEE